jgi:thymidylate synthase (FAD)
MSWENIESVIKEGFSATDRPEHIKLDAPRLLKNKADSDIESLTAEYAEAKYAFEVKGKTYNTTDERWNDLSDILHSYRDQRVMDAGQIHLYLRCTNVAINDIIRHYSISFFESGQAKEFQLEVMDEKTPHLFKYFIPPAWKKSPELTKEFNSAMTHISYLVRHAIEKGVPASQAKYIVPNATTRTLRMSMSLRSAHNYAGMRACAGTAQFENQLLSNQAIWVIKGIAPIFGKYLGPRCISEGVCREDEKCGNFAGKKEIYIGKTDALENLVRKQKELVRNTISENTGSLDGSFIKQYNNAYNKFLELKKANNLNRMLEPQVKHKIGIDGKEHEKLLAELAYSTFKRLHPGQPLESLVENEDNIAGVLDHVICHGHWGVLGHGQDTFSSWISRAFLKKIARHSSISLMASSQHHTDHSDFPYMEPPAWKEKGLGEQFHTSMVYLNDLYVRAMAAGIPKDQARYVLPLAALTHLTFSATPRSIFSLVQSRSDLDISWEERNISSQLAEIVKDRSPNLYAKLGPDFMVGLPLKPNQTDADKEFLLKVFRDRDKEAIKKYRQSEVKI